MKILHLSDTHIGSEKYFDRDPLIHVLNKLNEGGYDLLIHSGDITQEGKEEHFIEAQKLLSKVETPCVTIPGNHDKRSGGIALYKKYIGPPNGTMEQDEAIVIFVDSCVQDSNDGRVGMTKFNMISRALREYSDKTIKILVIHHHILPIPMAGRERNVLSNAGDLLDLFLRFEVDLVLSGHRHYPNVYNINNTVFVNAGTVSGKKTRYGDVNSYNEIDIDEDKLRVQTNRFINKKSVDVKEYPREGRRIFYDFGEKRFRIIHISNTFISPSTKFRQLHFLNALKNINSLEGNVLVHCGGIVEEGIPRDYDLAKNYMDRFDLPVVYTPAGRDMNYLGYDLYQEHFGDIDQSFTGKNFYLQGIASSQYDSPVGIIGETQRERVFQKLREKQNQFKCIFLHHNVLPIPHAREKGLLEDSGDFLREAVDEKVDLILTGTSSHPFAASVEKTVIVNANSLSSVYQRSLFGNSFNVIDVYDEAIVVSEINCLWKTRRLLGIWERNNKK